MASSQSVERQPFPMVGLKGYRVREGIREGV
jgi:hypothetical protein